LTAHTIEFPIYDPYGMEEHKKISELSSLVNHIKGNTKIRTTFFRFVKDNPSLKSCDMWFIGEEYKDKLTQIERRLLDSLRDLVNAANTKKYWSDKTEEENFDILRGLALEVYVETCIQKRYSDVFCNCIVEINNEPFCHKKGAYPSTLDVVGWNSQGFDGELYECKVSTYLLKNTSKGHEKLIFLNSLQMRLSAMKSNGNVAVASFENDFTLKKYLGKYNITIVGYQKLLHIDEKRCGIVA